LGVGDREERNIPTKIKNLPPIISVSSWNAHTLFLDDQCYVWISGQLSSNVNKCNIPIKINDVRNIVKIASDWHHCLLLDNKGKVFSFGSDTFGQLQLCCGAQL
jgi:hypothetical protein